jgi:hypothetical protein
MTMLVMFFLRGGRRSIARRRARDSGLTLGARSQDAAAMDGGIRRAAHALEVAACLGLLVLLQLAGAARQVKHGFVPFVHPPTRVRFSWDMFSPDITRCDVAWSPPLRVGERTIEKLGDVAPTLEFDVVMGELGEYRALALQGCDHRTAKATRAAITCQTPEGHFVDVDVACP